MSNTAALSRASCHPITSTPGRSISAAASDVACAVSSLRNAFMLTMPMLRGARSGGTVLPAGSDGPGSADSSVDSSADPLVDSSAGSGSVGSGSLGDSVAGSVSDGAVSVVGSGSDGVVSDGAVGSAVGTSPRGAVAIAATEAPSARAASAPPTKGATPRPSTVAAMRARGGPDHRSTVRRARTRVSIPTPRLPRAPIGGRDRR